MDDVKNLFEEESVKALKNAVVSLTADVDTLYRLVDDLMQHRAAAPKSEPVCWTKKPLNTHDLSRVKKCLNQWMTLEMLEVWISSKSRKGASMFLERVKAKADGYEVLAKKLPNSRSKMYCIVERKAKAA